MVSQRTDTLNIDYFERETVEHCNGGMEAIGRSSRPGMRHATSRTNYSSGQRHRRQSGGSGASLCARRRLRRD